MFYLNTQAHFSDGPYPAEENERKPDMPDFKFSRKQVQQLFCVFCLASRRKKV